MGVHGLWDLLAPVGRRVSVETLTGKRLAIDASIWMVQFMKAMRDEKGEMVRNAHLLGFFRRICKLLFLRTKPVFVFDGGTPALKRRTVIARRRQRENSQAKFRKTAEKLFLNQVKAMRLNNLVENLKDQTNKSSSKGKEVMSDQSDTFKENDAALDVHNQKMVDEMLAASTLTEECGGLDKNLSAPASHSGSASAFAPHSSDASTSSAAFVTMDEDDEDDEEMILPIADGNVDPAVLASLPPSMQLDLLVQMRERLMAENRQKYQKVKKAPQKFSELQIEAYLKTVAFRREIDEVQKAAAGKGMGGVQTSHIASETNREFIFSSSFSGDKECLVPNGAGKCLEQQQGTGTRDPSKDVLNFIAAATKSSTSGEQVAEEAIETYIDEKGRKRVSKRRAMGIRMTRDLQRNINLMKELEDERIIASSRANVQTEPDGEVCPSNYSPSESRSLEYLDLDKVHYDVCNNVEKTSSEAEKHKDASKTEVCINISFDDNEKIDCLDKDDEFFARLAAGSPVVERSADKSASDFEWEDGTVFKKSDASTDTDRLEAKSSHAEDGRHNESDVEWEDGFNIGNVDEVAKSMHLDINLDNEVALERKKENTGIKQDIQEISADVLNAVSKGSVEEEAALQEAIRRSLEDLGGGLASTVSRNSEKLNFAGNRAQEESCSPFQGIELYRTSVIESSQSCLLAGTDTYGDSSSDMNSISMFDTNVRRTDLDIPVVAERSFHLQQTQNLAQNAQHSALANSGSSVPALFAGGDLFDSVPTTVVDDMKNQGVGTNKFDILDVQAASITELQTFHADTKCMTAEDDACFANIEERGNDAQVSASNDDDNTNELLDTNLEEELSVLGQQYKDLEDEQKKLERNADSVNSEMFVECQELLQMFGLPYIIAPMEAEAQCAYLELANLVDGVVTDDSDVFVFGAQCVYKNIFDDRKYVETYLLKDIEKELGLNRDKLIRMALLLGSDYTEGVSGIGIVNAIEVVNAFPGEDGLSKFREWVEAPDPTILGKMGLQSGSSTKKNGSKACKNSVGLSEHDIDEVSAAACNALEENQDDESTKMKHIFMNKHRNVSKNWHIPASFPSDVVISAYKAPQVDKSVEPFTWGKPDIFSLRRLCWEKFSWANQKADELLLPVLKEYNKHETQLRLETFYSFNERFAKIRSKRIKQAVKGITGKRSLTDTDDLQEIPEEVKKRGKAVASEYNSKENNSVRDKSSKRSKSKKKDPKEGGSAGLSNGKEERRVVETNNSGVKRRGKGVRRGRKKESSDSELDDTSPDDRIGGGDDHELAPQAKIANLSDNVRRSKRARRAASYLENDDESDELTYSQNMYTLKCSNGKPGEQRSSQCWDVKKDDVTDAGGEKEAKLGVPSAVDGSRGEYLAKGGGFCTGEDGAEMENWAGSVQSEGPECNADSQYLQIGGGFCQEETEEQDFRECDGVGAFDASAADMTCTPDEKEDAGEVAAEHDGGVTATQLSVTDGMLRSHLHDDPSSVSKLTVNEQHETRDGNVSNVMQMQITEAVTPATVSAFSSIPFLKRKKKRP